MQIYRNPMTNLDLSRINGGSISKRSLNADKKGRGCKDFWKAYRVPDVIWGLHSCSEEKRIYKDGFVIFSWSSWSSWWKWFFFNMANKALAAIEKDILTQDDNCFVLRIGHYSHVECVTVTNNQPQTRTGKQGTPIKRIEKKKRPERKRLRVRSRNGLRQRRNVRLSWQKCHPRSVI